MTDWWLLPFSIVVGSLIGGLTNELAIRMLFRPLKPWKLGKWRIPFTPGLIPRRREELGRQMGLLVENHLLTKEGIRQVIAEGKGERALVDWLTAYVQTGLDSRRTVREAIAALAPNLFAADGNWSDSVRRLLESRYNGWIDAGIRQLESKAAGELIPPKTRQLLERLLQRSGEILLSRFRESLRSPEGIRQIQEMVKNALGGGGMFGGLVGMFMSDDLIAAKILPHLDRWLANPDVAEKLSGLIRKEAESWLDKPLKELLSLIGDEQVEEWKHRLFVFLEQKSLDALDKPVSELASGWREPLVQNAIPILARWLIDRLGETLERLFPKLPIAEIVTRQVEGFPLLRIEEMVIGITGKEFRMITLLGFLLGGLIGLIQGLLNIFIF